MCGKQPHSQTIRYRLVGSRISACNYNQTNHLINKSSLLLLYYCTSHASPITHTALLNLQLDRIPWSFSLSFGSPLFHAVYAKTYEHELAVVAIF